MENTTVKELEIGKHL